MATISIPEKIYKRMREIAENQGMSIEEYILSLAAESLDPESRAEFYWEASVELLKQAERELSKGDLRQASEKTWGAAALAVKALAYEREGRRLTSHRELWRYVSDLASETNDRELRLLWRTAVSMHVNFYENWATRDDIEDSITNIEKFIKKLKNLRIK